MGHHRTRAAGNLVRQYKPHDLVIAVYLRDCVRDLENGMLDAKLENPLTSEKMVKST